MNVKEYVNSILFSEYPVDMSNEEINKSILSGELYNTLSGLDWCNIDDVIMHIAQKINKNISICIDKRILFTDYNNKNSYMVVNGKCIDTENYETKEIEVPVLLLCKMEPGIKIL